MHVISRRIGFYIATAIAAVTVDFLIPRVMPGNPVEAVLARMQGQVVTPATLRALELQFGANTREGIWGQYTHYWNSLVHGNLGTSTSNGLVPVTTVIRGALPWTLGLVGTATVLSFVAGTLLGALVAWRRGSWLDNLLPATTFFQAAPYFFLAFLAIDLFAIKLGWFPPGSARGNLDYPAWNWTYIRVIWYAARNAILPSISGFSLAVGFVLSGALLTEIVFSYPGLGFILLSAVQNSDYALLQGIFLVITMAVLVANLAADFVYVFLDPRTRREA